MNKILLILIASVFLLFSCSKDEEILNHPPVANFKLQDNIDKFMLTSTATDVDGDELNYQWISLSPLISIDGNQNQTAYFNLPLLDDTTEITIKHIVCDGQFCDTVYKNIQIPVLTEIRSWGLGRQLEIEQSNNVNYEWYIDQMNTGTYNYVNCGPTSVTMAIKWYNEDFSKTPEDARNTYRSSGGWWYTNDIINYLNQNLVTNKTIELSNINLLVSELNNGNIIILCLDMFYIGDSNNDEWHINKFYTTDDIGWGHFIIIKGYKKVDNQILFEVYDPYCFGEQYVDNTLKGKDRYYKSNEIDEATNIWWDYAIIISKNTTESFIGLNINSIKHNYGK